MTETTTRPAIGEATTVSLYGWCEDFAEGKDTILARLFGEMVTRALPVVQQFHSDLYHDVHWLQQHVHGETEFAFLVRHSGTNIGESARIGVEIGAGRGYVLYTIKLTQVRGMWSATFTVTDRHDFGVSE